MALPYTFCTPGAFGKPNARVREWTVPTTPRDLQDFRTALVHHAYAIRILRFKNGHLQHGSNKTITQRWLAERDTRDGDALNAWNARLNGRRNLSMQDIALLHTHLPDCLPNQQFIDDLLAVVEHGCAPPPGWNEPDRRKA